MQFVWSPCILCKLSRIRMAKNKSAHGAEHLRHCVTGLNTSSYNEGIDYMACRPDFEFLSTNTFLMCSIGRQYFQNVLFSLVKFEYKITLANFFDGATWKSISKLLKSIISWTLIFWQVTLYLCYAWSLVTDTFFIINAFFPGWNRLL